jgi:hypothetical protein
VCVLDGNRYFRDLVNVSIGPYIAARTKLEKSDAIANIVEQVQRNSPNGGFIKKHPATGRWFRITESESRDKVGHAIRKAVLTRPKTAARIREENYKKRLSSSQNLAPASASFPTGHAAAAAVGDPQTALDNLYGLSQGGAYPASLAALMPQRDHLSINHILTSNAASQLAAQRLAAEQFFLSQSQSLAPPVSPYDQLLGRSLELVEGAKVREEAILKAIEENQLLGRSLELEGAKVREEAILIAIAEENRMKEMEYVRSLALNAPHALDDPLASLLAGAGPAAYSSLLGSRTGAPSEADSAALVALFGSIQANSAPNNMNS